MIEAKKLADMLNRLLELDQEGTQKLISHRVEFNNNLEAENVPFVCAKSNDGVITMGVIGFLNGMASPNTGVVAAVIDNKKLTGFTVVGCKECEPYQFESYAL